MKRLRHPIRAICEPFGKAGLTVAILALVLAMVGGAWAAAGLNSKQKKEVTKIAKKYAGKPGAPGGTGPAGANGSNGAPGEKGAPGTPGADGKSVALGTATAGECPGSNPSGGTTVEVEGNAASKKKVCNGKEGSPWTAGGTLPSGKSEHGTWGFDQIPGGTGAATVQVPISFPIPLAAPLGAEAVHIFEGETPPSGCTFNGGLLEAEAGNLCVHIVATGLSNHYVEEGQLTAFEVIGRLGHVEVATGPAGGGTGAVTAP